MNNPEEEAMPKTATEEPEVIEGEAVEEAEQQPTLAEYEAAKETVRVLLSTSPPNGEMAAADLEIAETQAYDVIERAERLGIQPSQSEADTTGVTVAMLPAIRDAVTTAEVERAHPLPAQHALPTRLEWEAAMAVAREIAKTQFVPKEIRGKPDQVLACILTGRELGIGPMESLRKINMIDGRPAFAAELMLSLMRKGGVILLETEATMEHALIKAKRSDTGETTTVEFTWEEAQRIDGGKLVNKSNWKNYRQDMLWARTVSRLGRRLAPDLLGGMSYSAEEVQDFDDGEYTSMATEGTPAALASESVTFRPGFDLLDKAPRDFQATGELLKAIDAAGNWAAWGSQARQVLFNEADFAKLNDEQKSEFGRRMANTAAYLQDEVMGGREFPPPTHDEVRKAFAWGFEGAVLTGPTDEGSNEGSTAGGNEPETKSAEIDPGKQLLPNAIKGADAKAAKKLNEVMTSLNDDVDWGALITAATGAQFKVESRQDLTPEQGGEWWKRLCNAVARLQSTAAQFESTLAATQAAFAWAFPAFEGEIPLREIEPTENVLSDEQAAALAAESEQIEF